MTCFTYLTCTSSNQSIYLFLFFIIILFSFYIDNVIDLVLFVFLELLGDILKSKPKETDGVESVIIVDGVPKVGPERVEKLKNVLHKLYSNFGKIVTVEYPLDENGLTKG